MERGWEREEKGKRRLLKGLRGGADGFVGLYIWCDIQVWIEEVLY